MSVETETKTKQKEKKLIMKKLTHGQLVALVQATIGALPVGILATTVPKVRITGNPFSLIQKTSRAVGFVGANYERSVNNEALRQGGQAEFEAAPLPWGKWLIKNKVIVHNGRYYLRTQATPGQRRKQPARVLGYRADGSPVEYAKVAPFLPKRQESAKQQDETGIDKTVWVSTYAFDSIEKIRINGETYQLVAGE